MVRIGIDLGGTNIVAGVMDSDYKLLAKARCKTNASRPAREIVTDMARMAREAVEKAGLAMSDVEHIGVGSPGTCNAANGIVEYANNLGFDHVPIKAWLEEDLRVPVSIENDANAAALGEALAGAARGARSCVCHYTWHWRRRRDYP